MLLAGHEQMLSVRWRDGRVTTRVCNALVLLRLSCLGETYIWYNFPVVQVSGLMFTGCCAASSSLSPPIQPWRYLMGCKNNDTNFNVTCSSPSAPLYPVCSCRYLLLFGSSRILTTWNKHQRIFTGKFFDSSTTRDSWAVIAAKPSGITRNPA